MAANIALEPPESPFDFSGGDYSDFEKAEELVTTHGGQKNDGLGAYLAYSTAITQWLKIPRQRLIAFIRTGACSPEQALAMDRHVHWFEMDFNCFARNRFGIIRAVRSNIEKALKDARAEDDRGDTTGQEEDVRGALKEAAQYCQAQARQAILESKPTRGLSAELVEQQRAEWDVERNAMEASNEIVANMCDRARAAYAEAKYLAWVESTIAEDRRKGLPVDEYDMTDVKDALANPDCTLDMIADRLPLSWQKTYQVFEMSLSSGKQHRDVGLQAYTQGAGYMPPEEGDRKGWRRWARRPRPRPSQRGRGNYGQSQYSE